MKLPAQDAHAHNSPRLFLIGQGTFRKVPFMPLAPSPSREHAGGSRTAPIRSAGVCSPCRVSISTGQDGHRIARFPPLVSMRAVRLFISGLETARLLHHCGVVIREAGSHLFGNTSMSCPEGGDEAVCHAVVVGTEFHGPPPREVEAGMLHRSRISSNLMLRWGGRYGLQGLAL